MRLQNSLFFSLFLALYTHARPTAEPYYDDLTISLPTTDHSTLPESGQIVFTPQDNTPYAIEGEGLDIFGIDLDDRSTDAMVADWKTEVVRQHNAYRAHYGAPAVSWSDALYPATQQWANQCKFEHSNGKGAYGENLAAGTGNAYGFSEGMKSWMDEASKYDYNRPGFSKGTGHFTQVVWKGSRQVACAIANCRGGTIFQQPSKYVVCRYSPPGNFVGRYKENVDRYR